MTRRIFAKNRQKYGPALLGVVPDLRAIATAWEVRTDGEGPGARIVATPAGSLP